MDINLQHFKQLNETMTSLEKEIKESESDVNQKENEMQPLAG